MILTEDLLTEDLLTEDLPRFVLFDEAPVGTTSKMLTGISGAGFAPPGALTSGAPTSFRSA